MKQIKLDIFDKTFLVRPDFRKVQAIENLTQKGTLAIAQEISEGKFRTSDLVSVVFCMIPEAKKSMNEVGDEVMGNAGKFLNVVAEFCLAANFGSEELASDPVDGGSEKND